MKKFSKVKYFGAVAAALLAVAPIAAPVVSQVAAPVTVQAAAAQPTTPDNAQFAKDLDAAFNDSVSGTDVLGLSGNDFNAVNKDSKFTDNPAPKDQGFVKLFAKKGVVPDFGTATQIAFTAKEFQATDNAAIAKEFNGNGRTTYNFTITLKDASGNALATKAVVLNVAKNSKASVTAAAYKVGDSTKSLDSGTNAAAAVTLTDRDGKTTPISDKDVSALFYDNKVSSQAADKALNTTTTNDNGVKYNNGLAVAQNDAFVNNGTFYQYIKLDASLFATGGKYANVDPAVAAANSNGTAVNVTDQGAGNGLYIIRTVNVTTGTNDQAYFPIVKYTTGTDSATSNTTTTAYYNGDTISDAALKYTAGTNTTSFYDSVYADLVKLVSPKVPGANPDSGNLYGYENSIKTGGLDQPIGGWTNYAFAGVSGTDAAPAQADVEAQLAKIITNPYAEGTYNVPLTVTNGRNLKSTVNIPVVIGTNVGAPVATEFVGYSTVVKGDKFDALADVQFKNSSLDNGVIPNSRIKVTSNVDTTTPGTYTVTYVVTNAAGKSATFTRTVVVTAGDLTESNASGVVYIDNASGAKVYSDTATSKETGNTLDNTTAWKYSSVVKDNAGKIVAYNLGGKQYVKAADVATSPVKAQAGVFTVHYPANAKWSIAVYNSDLKVIKLIPANSTWATFGTKTLKDGKSYYNLGGNQFARTDYGFWNAK